MINNYNTYYKNVVFLYDLIFSDIFLFLCISMFIFRFDLTILKNTFYNKKIIIKS